MESSCYSNTSICYGGGGEGLVQWVGVRQSPLHPPACYSGDRTHFIAMEGIIDGGIGGIMSSMRSLEREEFESVQGVRVCGHYGG